MPAGTLAGAAMPGPKTGVQTLAAEREVAMEVFASEPGVPAAETSSHPMRRVLTTRTRVPRKVAAGPEPFRIIGFFPPALLRRIQPRSNIASRATRTRNRALVPPVAKPVEGRGERSFPRASHAHATFRFWAGRIAITQADSVQQRGSTPHRLSSIDLREATHVARRVVVERERSRAHLDPTDVLRGVVVERGRTGAQLEPAHVLRRVVVEREGSGRGLRLCRSALRFRADGRLLGGSRTASRKNDRDAASEGRHARASGFAAGRIRVHVFFLHESMPRR